MHKTLSGKGYVKDGEGLFVTSAGEVYAYRDGRLEPMTTTDNPKAVMELESRWMA
ncbi:hypothetical protein BA720P3_00046 [Bifidobacterium phage BA720P3]|nr:hypothetical protein BA720P3_00046 [Bifidobacterium phage BA720P3]WAX05567.1 hypothetical protein BA746P1_00046 [Bifidobacterium phage BA746P1]